MLRDFITTLLLFKTISIIFIKEDTKINTNRREQMLRIARLYYIDGMEQSQIAKKESVSRPTVSRLLAMAREKGFVSIKVNDDFRDSQVLSEQLEAIYPDVKINVISTAQDDQKLKIDRVASSVAKYLHSIIKSGDIVGLGSGQEIYEIAQRIEAKDVRDVEILPLTGLFDTREYPAFHSEIATLFATAYKSSARLLPVPVIFNSISTKQLVETEKYVRYLEKLARLSNIVVFTVNNITSSPLFYSNNYLSEQEKEVLASDSIGEVLSHFIDINGVLVNRDLDSRTVSLPIDNLHYKDHAIMMVSDVANTAILCTVLKMKIVSQLFVDQQTAQCLLEYDMKEK